LTTVRFRRSALGGQSGGVPPVPIPNTEDKPVCVSSSTGVREPLGKTIRRPTHTSYHTRRADASPSSRSVAHISFSGCSRRFASTLRPDNRGVPLCLNERGNNGYSRQGGRVRPNAAACRAAHRRFKSGPWLLPYTLRSTQRASFPHLNTPSFERSGPL
jgi:hypothetical protein